MGYYRHLTEVENTDAEVFVYQIASSKKGNWYCRIKRLTSSGYFTKSLKTTKIDTAIKRATRHWMQLRDAEDRDIILQPTNNFKRLSEKYLKARFDKRSESSTRTIMYQFQNYFVPFFGKDPIHTINDRRYIQYLNKHRLINPVRKRPTLRTLSVEQSNLNSFLKWCYQNEYTRTLIKLSPIVHNIDDWIEHPGLVDSDKRSRRDLATFEVYTLYRRFLRDRTYWKSTRIKDEPAHVEMNRRRAHFYCISIYNFCCRAGVELLKVKWGDLKFIASNKKKGAYYVEMTARHGKKVRKTRLQRVDHLTYFSDYNYIQYLAQWKSFLDERGYPTGEDDYLFPLKKGRADAVGRRKRISKGLDAEFYTHWDSTASTAFLKRLRPKVLDYARELQDVGPQLEEEIMAFSWYSIRHVSIKRLIIESGYSLHFVAEKANTGISLIEDFYWKYGSNPEETVVNRSKEIDRTEKQIAVFDADVLAGLELGDVD